MMTFQTKKSFSTRKAKKKKKKLKKIKRKAKAVALHCSSLIEPKEIVAALAQIVTGYESHRSELWRKNFYRVEIFEIK